MADKKDAGQCWWGGRAKHTAMCPKRKQCQLDRAAKKSKQAEERGVCAKGAEGAAKPVVVVEGAASVVDTDQRALI